MNPFAAATLPVRQLEADISSLCVVTRDDRAFCAGPRERNPGCPQGADCEHRAFEVPSPRARALAFGGERICALTLDGGAWCWGVYGALSRATEAMHSPQRVELPARVAALAGGAGQACALLVDGRVFCWGARTAHARLQALNEPTGEPTPELIEGLPRVRALAGGLFHMCAVTVDGAVYCWGGNHYGQLGDGSERDSPTRAVRVFAPGAVTDHGARSTRADVTGDWRRG